MARALEEKDVCVPGCCQSQLCLQAFLGQEEVGEGNSGMLLGSTPEILELACSPRDCRNSIFLAQVQVHLHGGDAGQCCWVTPGVRAVDGVAAGGASLAFLHQLRAEVQGGGQSTKHLREIYPFQCRVTPAQVKVSVLYFLPKYSMSSNGPVLLFTVACWE